MIVAVVVFWEGLPILAPIRKMGESHSHGPPLEIYVILGFTENVFWV